MRRFSLTILPAIIVFLFVSFLPSLIIKIEASSNNYLNFDSITTKDGLSNNYIKAIFQDHYGYMWIGTMRGLNKSSNREFQVFDGKSSISNPDIRVINETSNGQLWVGTQKGLNLFNYTTKTFSAYLNNPEDPGSISNDSITAIFEDSRG
ncbi:MAG: two-component regulator propeller domain-containing protein, partial [Dehalococcoidales bacterium]|nr:two-component regulator propeller domain-containing protein [Dehalococcoidales bacterium]